MRKFNDTDEDDTIALSGDELSNILNSAEFTSHDAETIDTETEKANEPTEEIEEPVASEEAVNKNPKYINQLDRPLFLIIKAKKITKE